MDKKDFWVELEKEWFYNGEEDILLQEYNAIGLVVYSILKRNTTTRNTFTVCINTIADILKINKKDNNRFVTKIKNSINKMNDNLFVLYEDTNCTKKVDTKSIKLNNAITYYGLITSEPLKNKFMMIYDNEIDKLIDYAKNKKISIEDLLTHYIFICNGFKGKKKEEENPEGYKCWYGTYESITKKIGITKNTLINNNKIFKDLKLLLIGNAGGKTIDNDKYENTSNIYAKVGDENEFNTYMEIKKNQINKAFKRDKDKELQDEQRRLKQLYKTYQKKHNIDELNDIETMEEYNELYQLELNYFNFVQIRKETNENIEIKNAKFKTITHKGKQIKPYNLLQELEVNTSEFNDIENKIPQGYSTSIDDNEESWEGNEEVDFDELMKIDEEISSENEKECQEIYNRDAKELYEFTKANYEEYNSSIQEQFNKEFNGIKFLELKGKDVVNMKIKVEKFFNKVNGNVQLEEIVDVEDYIFGDYFKNKKLTSKEKMKRIFGD